MEDADNADVPHDDHLRGLHLDPKACLEGLAEAEVVDEAESGEAHISLTLTNGIHWLDLEGSSSDIALAPAQTLASAGVFSHSGSQNNGTEALARPSPGRKIEKLVFVPFYYRANRKVSGGISRVGLRRWYA